MDAITFGTQRLIHLDLKGAPPKISYLERFLRFVREQGATGILLEWEDTFPYSRELSTIGSLSDSAGAIGAPYGHAEAKQLLEIATDCGLTVIPLIQTFGHLEFVLKHDKYRALREVEAYPSSMCPSNSGAMPLVKSMIKQIVAFHVDPQYVHIGADEVWHLGLCTSCARRVQNHKHGKAALFLEHVAEVAQFIKDTYPGVRVIMWDDMLRNIDVSVMQDHYIGNLVEPMVWHYHSSDTFQIGAELWERYSNVFVHVWGATAFKGATSSCQILPVHRHHVSNHEAWLKELGINGSKMQSFCGIALTGWSRYDHYATLCELLPCAIPTLCLCLKTWLCGGYSDTILSHTSKLLGYTEPPLTLDVPIRPCPISPYLSFPGCQILVAIEWFLNVKTKYRNVIDSDQMHTWFNRWQVSNNYTNPMQIESALSVLNSLHHEVLSVENFLRTHLENIYYPPTTDELIGTLVTPMKQHLRQLKCECEVQIANGCRVRGEKHSSLN